MPRDPEVEDMLRDALLARLPRGTQLGEKPMFGGLCLMRDGTMIGAAREGRIMLQAGRPMPGFVWADETVCADDATLARLADMAVSFSAALPPK